MTPPNRILFSVFILLSTTTGLAQADESMPAQTDRCAAELARQKQQCRQRHIESLEHFALALQQKNHELVAQAAEIARLKAALAAAPPPTNAP